MMQWKTLDSRVSARAKWDKVENRYPTYQEHVRAELDRLARQVRKLNTYGDRRPDDKWVRLIDVLALLREARK